MEERKRPDVTLLIPPQITFGIKQIIKDSLALHKLKNYREIEAKAGCRRFLLTDDNLGT